MQKINIYNNSLVLISGGRKTDWDVLIPHGHGNIFTWDVNHPDEMREALREMIKQDQKVAVTITNVHAKAVSEIINMAHKHGLKAHVLSVQGSADLSAASEKADSYHSVKNEIVLYDFLKMPSDKRDVRGPFDLIGDIHGVADELRELLVKLGHMTEDHKIIHHAEKRIPVFLGDYTDRGPKNKDVLEIVRAYTQIGGYAILGNHDDKLMRWLLGKNVNIAAGLAVTIEELSKESEEWRRDMAEWLESLETHLVFDNGNLVVAHAGLEEEHHGRHSTGARSAALYGKPIEGGTVLDDDGYPLSEDWAQNYSGHAAVVHGHVVYNSPRELNNVYAVDTGAVFGGSLTALRWPEKEYVSVKAKQRYFTHPKVQAA